MLNVLYVVVLLTESLKVVEILAASAYLFLD